MDMDIKALQAAIASEVNRREFERHLAAEAIAPAGGEFQALSDLVRALEPVDLGAYFSVAPAQGLPAPGDVAVAAGALPAQTRALRLHAWLYAHPLGKKILGHPRVVGILEHAKLLPGGGTLGNVVLLLCHAVLKRIPVVNRVMDVMLALRALPAQLAQLKDIAGNTSGALANTDSRLRELARDTQDQVNHGGYAHALAAQQNEQHLLARIRRLEQRVRELNVGLAADKSAALPPGATGDDDLPADLYVDFEAQFRGDPALIRQRLMVYLPRFRAHAAVVSGLVVDLGCGRGEWLQLLADEGIPARGVDSNLAMIALCSEKGLAAELGNALDYLAQQPDHSLAALTAFHLIEHLPAPALVRLLDQARRVLVPGGLLLVETPNPENLIVGACNFYIDPTHRNPLPPALTSFLLQARGFTRVEVERCHPADPALHLAGAENNSIFRLNNLLFGPQDYAAMGYAP